VPEASDAAKHRQSAEPQRTFPETASAPGIVPQRKPPYELQESFAF